MHDTASLKFKRTIFLVLNHKEEIGDEELNLYLTQNKKIPTLINRRVFAKGIAAISASMLMQGLSSCDSTEAKSSDVLPKNWMWLRPNLKWSDDQWKSSFATLKEIGIEAILPQVYDSRSALFDHPTMPVKQRWLERILPIAHQAGLEVHAWMWSMILDEPNMIKKHPDWFSVSREGKPSHTDPAYVGYYKFMCPCHPEVQEFVGNNVAALAKIEDLDGIHLDYIRQPDVILAEALQPKYDIVQDKEYPQYDYPYSQYCRTAFKDQSGIDPMELGDRAPAHEAWRQFRYDAISNVVNNFAVPQARKQNKKITAAVFPNWESVRQQWHRWDLDGFLPMLYHGFYNEDIPWIGEQVSKNEKMLIKEKPIFAGVYLPHLHPTEISAAHRTALQNGASGISFFGHENLTDEFAKEIKSILR